jgi:hypothetical protein
MLMQSDAFSGTGMAFGRALEVSDLARLGAFTLTRENILNAKRHLQISAMGRASDMLVAAGVIQCQQRLETDPSQFNCVGDSPMP